MRDHDGDRDDAPDEGALLAAFLDAETDDVTSARIYRRLIAEPALAQQLDAIAAARSELQRLSNITAPDEAKAAVRARLTTERSRGAVTPTVTRRTPDSRSPRWMPVAAAAALVLVAVMGLASVLNMQAGSEESADGGAESAASNEQAFGDDSMAAMDEAEGDGEAAAEQADSGGDEAGNAAAGRARSEAAAEAGGSTDGITAGAPPAVTSDAEIVERARRLADRDIDLASRERRLRQRAALPTGELCAAEVDGRTVDLIAEEGRVALAVLLPGDRRIVVLEPRTCAAIRTIATER